MADEPHEIRSINWREVFVWTHLFRGFRMAIDPKKLLFAIVALVAVFLFGHALDLIWGRAVPSQVPLVQGVFRGETNGIFNRAEKLPTKPTNTAAADWVFAVAPPNVPGQPAPEAAGLDAFAKSVTATAQARNAYVVGLLQYFKVEKELAKAEKLIETAGVAAAIKAIKEKLPPALEDAKKAIADILAEQDKLTESKEKAANEATAKEGETGDQFEARKEALTKEYQNHLKGIQALRNFQNYELSAAYKRVDKYLDLLRGEYISETFANQITRGFELLVSGVRDLSGGQAFYAIKVMALTPIWLFHQHTSFAVFYLLFSLVVVSLAGGAICRIAAVEFAKDEKIQIKEAAVFAFKKASHLVLAPLIPLVIVGFIAAICALVALLMNMPFAGELLTSLTMFLALLGGFVMALVVVLTVAGVGLMHPTIAVEGSDAFDAISRGFTYVFSKPWTLAWYTVLAIAYGSFSYVFARFFVWLMLWMAHTSVNTGVFVTRPADVPTDDPTIKVVTKFEAMWASPSFERLFDSKPEIMFYGTESVASKILAFWVGLVLFGLSGFILTFIYSELTVMYYLLRHQVDATELDDVYIEEPEDEFTELATPTATATKPPEPARGKIDLPLAPSGTASAAVAPPPPAPPVTSEPPPAPPVTSEPPPTSSEEPPKPANN